MTQNGVHRIWVDGTVQGVGFRPFVWRLATELGLAGTVRNIDGRVEIEAYGPPATVDALVSRLRTEAPRPARIDAVTVAALPPGTPAVSGFTVAESRTAGGAVRLFPPDLATCDACRRELFDPADRRYRYPFINCTDCGPRATIIDSLPYDRARTTMVDFPLCRACRREYADPADRRFHAEPVACPDCGPTLTWLAADARNRDPSARITGEAALRRAVTLLAVGGIVAVKGLGGYHLACDATDEAAVARLRERKHRWAKPLAVMVADVAAARAIAHLDDAETAELTSRARPIVLARQRNTSRGEAGGDAVRLAPSVSVGIRKVGLFLPYTGLHHLLLAETGRPLVLTSGNRSDEPIAVDDDEAFERLADIADGFLAHDRRIRSRYEDSVVTVAGGGPVVVRRGRGFAPTPLDLPVATPEPVLAVGAQLKHTFAIAVGRHAHLAGHTGDLEDLATLHAYQRNLAHLRGLLEVEPAWVAHDLHPAYLSTQQATAEFTPQRRIAVQHHHAHAASCLAEHGLRGPAVCVALDGLGMGDDGTFWGGEVLVADLVDYRRVGRFGRAPMPGGAAAVREPWRMALGYLLAAEDLDAETPAAETPATDTPATGRPGTGGSAGDKPATARSRAGASGTDPATDPRWCDPGPYLAGIDPAKLRVIRRQLARGINAPVASSAGRLFDAASAILGLCPVSAYEGQAAIALEQAADPDETGELPYRIVTRDGVDVYDPRPTLAALLESVAAGTSCARLAARFQRTMVAAVGALATRAAVAAGLDTVCLSGGVFGNEWLLTEVPRRLAATGLTVVYNRRIPAGDGGISLGQAAVAAARLAAGSPWGRGASSCV